jgi:hypothetical protein
MAPSSRNASARSRRCALLTCSVAEGMPG